MCLYVGYFFIKDAFSRSLSINHISMIGTVSFIFDWVEAIETLIKTLSLNNWLFDKLGEYWS